MATPTIPEIASELNDRAPSHPIGALQKILGHRRGQSLFRLNSKTVTEWWACHWGGRIELQFNIGLGDDRETFRHGVAFDFGSTISHPAEEMAEILTPKLLLLNKFLGTHPGLYKDMSLWAGDTKYPAAPMTQGVMDGHSWFFLGKRQALNRIDYERILDDFDRLLPLYQYVETAGKRKPVSVDLETRFAFQAGCRTKKRKAIVRQCKEQIERDLRHNELQKMLFRRLAREFGKNNVGTENQAVNGTRIDLVVRRKSRFWFYEIKTADSVRACIREAIGQLLEYAFWPGAQKAARLVVAGELAMDKDGEGYLRRLRDEFSLPIEYEQIIP